MKIILEVEDKRVYEAVLTDANVVEVIRQVVSMVTLYQIVGEAHENKTT